MPQASRSLTARASTPLPPGPSSGFSISLWTAKRPRPRAGPGRRHGRCEFLRRAPAAQQPRGQCPDQGRRSALGLPGQPHDQGAQRPRRGLDEKNHQTHYGYKDHVKVDVRDKLILKAVVTAAGVHDSQALDELIEAGDRVVYADCQSAAIAAALAAKNVEPQINEKGTRGHPLTDEQKGSHRGKSKTGSRVEHVFAQNERQHESPVSKIHRHGAQRHLPEAHQPRLQPDRHGAQRHLPEAHQPRLQPDAF
ncbi:MAG: transposase [Chthoniobacteraceae bacterium]